MSTSIGDVMAARRALTGYVYETPVVRSHALSTTTGHHRVLLKCENLQRTGSYHFRGAMYKVIRSKAKELDIDNFVSFSSANSGPALACAAQQFQATARVVVPRSIHANIKRSIEHYKGRCYEVEPPTAEGRNAVVKQLMSKYSGQVGKVKHTAQFVHPYTDPLLISGYGTLGVELMLQTDCSIDCVIAPIGGGALLTGIALAVKGMKPNVAVYGVQPCDMGSLGDAYVGFKRGDLDYEQKHQAEMKQGCALPVATPEETTSDIDSDSDTNGNNSTNGDDGGFVTEKNAKRFPRVVKGTELNKLIASRDKADNNHLHHSMRQIDGIINVTESEVRYAFRYLYERCKLVVDVKSAAAVAGLLAKAPELKRFTNVAIIISGGNVDIDSVPGICVAKL